MEVDRTAFPQMLPTMLKHLSTAHFVAFDLELSGIPTRKQHASEGKQTLQQRYAEVKRAAETFHILQVGLTCVEQDTKNDKYLTRSFNFNLSPLVGDGLDVEREFTYSTGAVDFLLSVGYSMDAPFKEGVPYLTKEETQEARQRAMEKWDRSSIPDISIRPDDEKALKFMKRVRKEIDEWQKSSKPNAPYYNVGGRLTEANVKMALNRFEKRLVHQIVRAEFPDLQSHSGQDYVTIDKKDEEAQSAERQQTERRLNRALFNNIGFRWLTEAMAAGDLSNIDMGAIGSEIAGEKIYQIEVLENRLDTFRKVLVERPRVLVGHNCFMDLVFIYRYFYGSLPDTVEEFQELLHTLFPIIVDTKFLSTSGPDAFHFRNSQLWQIEEALANDETPVIDYPNDHPRYLNSEKYHEAGFDSFVTSKVFLRLASRLHGPSTAKVVPPSDPQPPGAPAEDDGFVQAVSKKNKKLMNQNASATSTPQSRFSHANMYNALPEELVESPASTSSAVKPDIAGVAGMKSASTPSALDSIESDKLVPGWDNEFWTTYGNKLRVFGTREEVCDLTAKRKVVAAEPEAGDAEKIEEKNDEDEGGVQLERRPSIISSLGQSLQSLLLGKK